MAIDDDRLLRLAESISDGGSVEWPDEVPGEESVVRHLRVIERISRLHRSSAGGTPMQPGDRWEDLEIRERIGGGAFGDVYRAWDPKLEREVALKVAAPGASSIGVREGRLLAKVRHPNVLAVHGADERDGRLALRTELVAGRTLEQILRESGPYGPKEAAAVGVDLCRALAAVHREGILHRDVKAQNVVREHGGRIVLMDFGAGAATGSGGDGAPAGVSGTPLYMAPELLEGRAPDAGSDLYSLGVLLFHLLTGDCPIKASSLEAFRAAHGRREMRRLRDSRPDLPESLVRAIEHALAADPAERFRSAGEMESALAAAIENRPVPRRRWMAALASAAAIVVAALAWATIGRSTRWAPAYEVEASLFHGHDGATEPVTSGGRVQPGDSLYLEVRGSIPLWVYVLNRDGEGRTYLLFPLPGYDLRNPLPSGVRHRLPGPRSGEDSRWQVTSAGGTERLLIVSSPERLREFEAGLRSLDVAEAGRPVLAAPVSPGAVRVLRGIGGVVDDSGSGRDDAGEADAVFSEALRLASGAETVRGVWVRQIVLANP